ncbi:hypothetical protein P0W94_000590 [Escherichia coli]|nr:hypothetical protein [Escherichia coli]
MSRLAITTIVFSLFLTSCSWDPNGAKAQEKWLSQKNEEKQAYDKQVEESPRKAGFKYSAKKSLNLKFHIQRLSLLVLGTSLKVRVQNLCEMRTTAFHS